MSYPILLILSDWTFFLLRLIFGLVVVFKGKKNFSHSKPLGSFELIIGFLIFIGFLTNWASLLFFIFNIYSLIKGLYKKSLSPEKLSFFLLISALSLFFFTKGAGFLSIDESWFWLL